MSRNITQEFFTAVSGAELRPFWTCDFFFDTEVIRFWNGVSSLEFNGNTYIGSGNLLSFDRVEETKEIQATGIRFQLSGINTGLISVALSENYQGRKIDVHFGLMANDGSIIPSPVRIFSGSADVLEIEEGGTTSRLVLSAESDLISLRRATERRRTPEDQRQNFQGDSFFDYVASLKSQDIVWGNNA